MVRHFIGGSRGGLRGLQPPLCSENFTKKRSFLAIFYGCNPPPFPDRMVDKSSHEMLQTPPPFQKFLDPPIPFTPYHNCRPSWFFRAQEPKAPVTYCDHALSGVRRPSSVVRRPSSVVCRLSSVRLFTFSTSSPEPLDGFWWNLVWMKYSRSLTSVVVFRPDPSRGGSRAGQK